MYRVTVTDIYDTECSTQCKDRKEVHAVITRALKDDKAKNVNITIR